MLLCCAQIQSCSHHLLLPRRLRRLRLLLPAWRGLGLVARCCCWREWQHLTASQLGCWQVWELLPRLTSCACHLSQTWGYCQTLLLLNRQCC